MGEGDESVDVSICDKGTHPPDYLFSKTESIYIVSGTSLPFIMSLINSTADLPASPKALLTVVMLGI